MITRRHPVFTVFFMFVLLFSCMQGTAVSADTQFMAGVSTGKWRITNENIPDARKNAISDALEQALQNAVISMVSRDALARNLGVLYGKLLGHTPDYIVTYKVLAELEQADHYFVAVESKVDTALLDKFLKDRRIVNPNPDIPTILPLISEKNVGEVLPRYWWGNNPLPYESVAEEVLIQMLEGQQILCTANGIYRPEPSFFNIAFSSVYDADAAMSLGEQMKTDMVMIGSARALEAPNRIGDEKTYMAAVELDIYHVETRQKVAAVQVQETASSIDEKAGNRAALIKAARAAGEAMVPKINQFWAAYLKKERTIEMTVNGDHFLPRYVALKDQLAGMPEIESIVPKELGTHTAVLGVVYKGNARQFAGDLVLKSFDSFGIEISQVTDTSLTIQFVPLADEKNETADGPGDQESGRILDE